MVVSQFTEFFYTVLNRIVNSNLFMILCSLYVCFLLFEIFKRLTHA